MSVYEKFTTTSAALAAFALGKCRRHVEVGGHVIDLVQAMAEEGRVREEPEPPPEPPVLHRESWDQHVAANVRAALRGRFDIDMPPPARSEIPPKPAPVCPCCLRPEGPT